MLGFGGEVAKVGVGCGGGVENPEHVAGAGVNTPDGHGVGLEAFRCGWCVPDRLHPLTRIDRYVQVIACDGHVERLTVQTGDEITRPGEGGFVWLPRDVPHTFRVDSDEAHFLEFITPAGIEQFHLDASDPAPSQQMPPASEPDIPRILQAIEPYGAEILGPPMGHGPR